MRFLLSFVLLFVMSSALMAQMAPPHAERVKYDTRTLMTVGDIDVSVAEFAYIYGKNNAEKADYSEASVRDYLDLYSTFKLKVAEARAMKLDTVPSLNNELNGYRRQLASSYLMDNGVNEALLREAFDRSKTDKNVSHILVLVKDGATPDQEAKAKQVIDQLHLEIVKGGKSFEALAKASSQDPSAKENGGRIGWMTALQFPGLYDFETAAYETAVGEVSAPVRTRLGWHIVKVNDSRPARGEVEAAHILIRPKDGDKAAAKKKLEAVEARLMAGEDFGKVAQEVSEHVETRARGGYIGFFGIGKNVASFEDAAFGIKSDGGYSDIVESPAGYHIIKRISVRKPTSYQREKSKLKNKVQRDSRFEKAKSAFVVQLKDEYNFKLKEANVKAWKNKLDKTFVTYGWKPNTEQENQVLFTYGDRRVFTVFDFEGWLRTKASERIKMGRIESKEQVASKLLDRYIGEQIIGYEESQLERKYPEFKSLMREFEEGILQFEATRMNVWDKASQDSVGLAEFHASSDKVYNWPERVEVTKYTIESPSKSIAEKARKLAAKKSVKTVEKKLKLGSKLTTEELTFAKGVDPVIDNMSWKPKSTSQLDQPKDGVFVFYRVDKRLPEMKKTLGESRGFVIADYQNFLNDRWVESLKKKYPIKINDEVFKSILR